MESLIAQIEDYWWPPTPDQRLRRARTRLCRQAGSMERRLKVAQMEERACVKSLHVAAPAADESALRDLAIEVARKRAIVSRLRDGGRMLANADGRLTMAESVTAVREAMADAARAMATATEGGPSAWKADVTSLQRQAHAVEEMDRVYEDADPQEEEYDTEETVRMLMDDALLKMDHQMPKPPTNPSVLHASAAVSAQAERNG